MMWFFAPEALLGAPYRDALLGTPYRDALLRAIYAGEVTQARDAIGASPPGLFRHDALTYAVARALFTRAFCQTLMARGSPTNTASAMRP